MTLSTDEGIPRGLSLSVEIAGTHPWIPAGNRPE